MRYALIVALCLLASAAAAMPIVDARQLTFEGKRAGEGYFSADGTRMIFQSERAPDNPFYQIYLLDFATGDVDRLSTGIGKTTCGWLHPDGERALFASTQFDPEAEAKMQAELDFRASGETRRYAWDYDPTYDLVETHIEDGGYRKLTDVEGYDAEGAYSPDGSKIVFASNRAAYARDLSAEEAVDICEAGGIARTNAVTVRSVAGEKFDRITDWKLGPIPPRLDGSEERGQGGPAESEPDYAWAGDDIPF